MLSTIILAFCVLFKHLILGTTKEISNTFVILYIGIFSIAFILDITRSNYREPIRTSIIMGYLLRVFLVFFDIYGRGLYQLPNSGADSEWFYRQGVLLTQGMNTSENSFIRIVSLMIRIFGNSRLLLQFLLMLTSIVTILCIDECFRMIGLDDNKRRSAITVIAMLPNYAILCSIFLRESLVAMFIAVSILFFLKWWIFGRELLFLLSFIIAFIGAYFHSGVVSVAMGLILARLLCNKDRVDISISVRSITVAAVFMFIFVYLYNNYTGLLFGKMQGLETIEDVSNNSNLGDASYASIAGNSNNLVNMIIYTPIRMLMFQFAPFFWQIRGVNDIIAIAFDSLFYMLVYYRTIKYLRQQIQEHRAIIIALFIVGICTSFVFGWGVANFGTALRHRNKMIAIYGILLGLTLPYYNEYTYN